jgi:hypothetical protein
LKQIRITAQDFGSTEDSVVPDAVLSEDDLSEIRKLAGIENNLLEGRKKPKSDSQENISHTAMKRVDYMKRHNIQPGTDEWFALWFSRPYLTGTTGMNR